MFRRMLIANRGEIAVRVIRACRELGITAVAVFSEADRAALHVQLADEAYPIGPAPSRESYLRIDRVIEVARRARCDALHPGYGFLSENPELPRACQQAELVFVGPTAEAMQRLGSKTAARQLAAHLGVPTVPGTLDPIEQFDQARQLARQIGFPVLLKAVAGGGGKGMRLVEQEAELASAWQTASSEALNAFGDGRLYLERLLVRPRHIEIQFLADHYGRVVYLGERECSLQRRHQKVVEEACSLVVDEALRRRMGEAAVRLAGAAGYTNAGTAEFLVDEAGQFYFLEVNTRLQVEHPVTEAITGLDLVQLQIRLAAGEPMPFTQDEVRFRGHAIECRIYAEDPENHFFPCPGRITSLRLPEGPGVRNDCGVYAGWRVPEEYDPLLSKLIVWGSDRAQAVARLQRALEEFVLTGIKTNLDLFRRLVQTEEFRTARFHTCWLDEWLPHALTRAPVPETEKQAAALAAVFSRLAAQNSSPSAGAASAPSPWKQQGRYDQLSHWPQR